MEVANHFSPKNGDIELGLTLAQPSDRKSARETKTSLRHSRTADLDYPPPVDESQSQSLTESASLSDSAYVSSPPTIGSGTSGTTIQGISADEPTNTLQEGCRLRGTDWYWFNIPVNKTAREHYGHVVSKINTFLTKTIRNTSRERSRQLAVKVRVIGKTKQDARVRLVVLCKPEVEDSVQKAMNGNYVADILSYNRSNIPQLDFLVIADAPNLVSKHLDVDVYCNNSFALNCDTFCGAPILLQHPGKDSNYESRRLGTFGGMIEVTYAENTQLLGMTAGHAAELLQRNQLVEYSETEDECTGAFKLGGLGSWICEHNVLGTVLDTSSMPAVSDGKVVKSHDWALFEVKEPRPNLAVHTSSHQAGVASEDVTTHDILQAELPQFNDDLSDPVLLLGGTKGTRRGELSSLPASICIGDTPVDAYTMEIHEGEVCEGDSGAWVVHSASPALYGHVVATDAFGDAYVIRALDTLENIRKCLGAVSVQLPTSNFKSKDNLGSKGFEPKNEQGNTNLPMLEKMWNPLFSTARGIRDDTSFVQELQRLGIDGDSLDIFLRDDYISYTSFMNEEVKQYCEGASVQACVRSGPAVGRRSAWLDDKSVGGGSRTYPSRLTAGELRYNLSQKRFGLPALPDGDRRLIYIADLSPEYILALVDTVTHSGADILRDAIWKYLASQTSIRVTVPYKHSLTFALEFHLPYLALRPCLKPKTQAAWKRYSKNRRWTDTSFLATKETPSRRRNDTLYQAQFSLSIYGTDNRSWTAYCFSDTYFDNDLDVEKMPDEDSGYESWDFEEDADGGFIPDQICSGYHDANLPIWDPRDYFLMVIKVRATEIMNEWRHLIRAVEHGILRFPEEAASRLHSQSSRNVHQSLDSTVKTAELLKLLKQNLTRSCQAWQIFLAQNGDVNYMSDSMSFKTSILAIKEIVQELGVLEQRVCDLDQTCKEEARILELRLRLEYNRLSHESYHINMLSNRLQDKAQILQSETNQTLKSLQEIALLCAPFALVSTFFSIPGDRIITTRDPQHFVVAFVCTTVALLAILWVLRSFGYQIYRGVRNIALRRTSKEERYKRTADVVTMI